MKTKVQKWGNSQGLRFSREVLRKAHIAVGEEVEVTAREGTIIVKPVHAIRGRYNLEELAARMPAKYKPVEEGWGACTGREVW